MGPMALRLLVEKGNLGGPSNRRKMVGLASIRIAFIGRTVSFGAEVVESDLFREAHFSVA